MTTEFLKLDVWNTKNVIIKVNQGEVNARFLQVQFMDKSEPLDLENRRVFFFAKKPDGNLIFNRCEIIDEKNGTVNLELTSQMSIVDGIIRDCEFDIIDLDLARLKVKGLILKIEKCTDFDSATESTSEFTALEEAIVWCEKAKDIIDEHIEDKNNPHGVTTEQIGAAETIHTHSTDDITSGTLPIARGGTGATDASDALTNLGAVPITRTINNKQLNGDIALTYSDIQNTPTNISSFTNDVGYLTTETDPTVPNWAKASSKPSYSYSEISNAPTKLSEFTNDAGYISGSLPSLWYVVTSAINKSPVSICYGNSLYVVVCTSGGIYTSTDGFTWTSRTSNVTAVLRSVIYTGTQYIIVGDSGTILTSDDGITWTAQTSNVTVTLNSVCYANSKYVVVGGSGTILTSDDTINWSSKTAGTKSLRSIRFGNGIFVVVGNNGVLYTSSDAATWTSRSPRTTKTLISLCYGNDQFLAGGSSGITTYSTDGINWTSNQTESPYDFNAICYGDNEFKMVGAGGSILSSQDGLNWQSESNPYTTGHYRCIIYDGSKYYAAYDATSKNILVKLNKLSDILKYIASKM